MIGAALRRGLQQEGHSVDWARDAKSAEAALAAEAYELVLLDLGLPDRDGMALLASLRRSRSPVPVIISTARDAVADRVRGLDLGADDYLVKPYDFDELSGLWFVAEWVTRIIGCYTAGLRLTWRPTR